MIPVDRDHCIIDTLKSESILTMPYDDDHYCSDKRYQEIEPPLFKVFYVPEKDEWDQYKTNQIPRLGQCVLKGYQWFLRNDGCNNDPEKMNKKNNKNRMQ